MPPNISYSSATMSAEDTVVACHQFIEQKGFSKVEYMGTGSSAHIFQYEEGGRPFVAKCVQLPRHQNEYSVECNILWDLHHLHIVQVFDIFHTTHTGVLTMERMNADLLDAVEAPLPGETLLSLFYQVCLGIQYLHTNHYAHLDIKPENILLREDEESGLLLAKLADFGLARELKKDVLLPPRRSGTYFYSAPEVNAGDSYYGDKADVWSLGILLHVILTGTWPYCGDESELNDMAPSLSKIDKALKYHPDIDAQTIEVLDMMLQVLPERRASVAAIISHPFFRSVAREYEKLLPKHLKMNKFSANPRLAGSKSTEHKKSCRKRLFKRICTTINRVASS